MGFSLSDSAGRRLTDAEIDRYTNLGAKRVQAFDLDPK